MTINLLAFHVDILSLSEEISQTCASTSDTGILLSDFTLSMHTGQERPSMPGDSADTPYSGWADVKWLCTVGHGCVCGEDCDEIR